MKRILLGVLILALASLACSTSIVKPAAQFGASVGTVTSVPSPTLAITPSPTATAGPELCTVTAKALHLRNAPSIEGIVIAWLYQGDQVTILPEPPAGNWRKVKTAGDRTGWINSLYCER